MANSAARISFYDIPMWDSIGRKQWELQRCDSCGAFRYPPGPACPYCGSMAASWKAISGRGTIFSWVVFHRQYFDDYPPPYNVVSVELAEGPLIVSNLVGDAPDGDWIGHDVTVCYEEGSGGRVLPKVRLAPPRPP